MNVPLVRCLAAFFLALILPLSAYALIMRDSGPEPVIVQIKESLRTSDDLDDWLNELKAFRQENRLKVEKWWAGNKLLMLISFPPDFTQQQAIAVMRQLQKSPAVEKAVPFSAQNLEFRSGDFSRGYVGDEAIPDVARRGFDKDRIHERERKPLDRAALSKIPHAPGRISAMER